MNPIYIKIDRHKKVGTVIGRIKTSLEEAKTVLARLNELKDAEEHELTEWKAELERISSKVSYIEETLSTTGGRIGNEE